MSISNTNKPIENKVCAANGCLKSASVKILFQIGFSALFCEECAFGLVNEGIGMKERRAEKLLDSVGEVDSNTPIKSSSPSSKEIEQRR